MQKNYQIAEPRKRAHAISSCRKLPKGLIDRKACRVNQDAIPEMKLFPRFQRQTAIRQSLVEVMLGKGAGKEHSIRADMPGSREAEILWRIHHSDTRLLTS